MAKSIYNFINLQSQKSTENPVVESGEDTSIQLAKYCS